MTPYAAQVEEALIKDVFIVLYRTVIIGVVPRNLSFRIGI